MKSVKSIDKVRHAISGLVRFFLEPFGLALVGSNELRNLKLLASSSFAFDAKFESQLGALFPDGWFREHMPKSRAQLRQDLFVLGSLNLMRSGYFVEFGATDGVTLSNTYLLEKDFGWTGLLAEPARGWHAELLKNRSCLIDTRAVWRESDKTVLFHETPAKELSGVAETAQIDGHAGSRGQHVAYPVTTVSLVDLLRQHSAPRIIDYLSIDTEGSEFEILEAFDFTSYDFRVVTVEHNHTPLRGKIYELMTDRGYRRVFPDVSDWEDWYLGTAV